jgi:alpha-1,3-glucosyltransferase
MWLFVLPIWLACTRESYLASANSSQVLPFMELAFIIDLTAPMSSLLAAESNAYFRTFVITTVAGVFSLFPLLFTPAGNS